MSTQPWPSSADASTSNSSSRPTHHRSKSSLLPSLNSLGSFLSAGLTQPNEARRTGGLSTDAELMISDPSPTVWADESPIKARSGTDSVKEARSLGEEVRFRGSTKVKSDIAFPTSERSPSRSSSTSTAMESEASGSTDTPATSVFSPPNKSKKLYDPASSEATIKPSPSNPRYQTLPRSFAPHPPAPSTGQDSEFARTTSLHCASEAALSSQEKTVQRQAGFRARSLHSIRGLAAAWVPSRFVSQPSSSASETSSDDLPPPLPSPSRAVTKVDGERSLVVKTERPVKLDRRRLDKAVSLAVEAAQAAEEDERIWEEKQRTKGDSDSEVEDDVGFSLDLYISSLGYLISAISDKDATALNGKQKEDIRRRLEEGMSKLGFDAKAELEQAQELKRQLELERGKLELQKELGSPANVIHHHYHTAVPGGGWMGEGGNFSRAHAAAKASSRGSSSLAGKIGSGVLDVGLHIGAGALSALSANLGAIAPTRGGGRAEEKGKVEDVRITDMDNGEDLQNVSEADASPRASQPSSGTATPRTAWTRAINQNNKQWELAVAFASTAASALASSLGAVARSDPSSATAPPMTKEEQMYLARYEPETSSSGSGPETAEDRLILLSASLARSLKRSPLPTQLYQLLRQLVSILAAIDAKYSLTEKGTQLAVRETSRAMRFVRKHDLHVKAVRVAWAAAEAAVAALEAYRDERGWIEVQQQQQGRLQGGAADAGMYGASPPKETLAIADRQTVEARIDDAEARILKTAQAGKDRKKVGQVV
ncbi:hypothetical protein PHBOTO_002503 [Pseudozyma hubeiensis]|nr:hypothetical protein PHBOTO_002503 [Pseudozyma hubeiensis]